MAAIDILGLGAVAVDDLLYVDGYPPADTKTRVQQRERRCGGLAAAALVGAARLGARCAYAGVLGQDELSVFALQRLSAEGIDTSGVQRSPEGRCIHSVVIVDRVSQTRNIFYDTDGFIGAALHWPSPDVIQAAAVLLVDHVRVAGMIRAAEVARTAGRPVVGDLESDRDPAFSRLLDLVDHLIIPASFGRHLTGESDVNKAALRLQRTHRTVVLTQGKAGCVYVDKNGAVQHQPAFNVQTVNTTGCGDVFHGAYALALARGLPLATRIRKAAAAAAVHAAGTEKEPPAGFAQAVERLLTVN